MKKDIIKFLVIYFALIGGIFAGFVTSYMTMQLYQSWEQPRVVLKYIDSSGNDSYAPIVAARSFAQSVYEKTDGQVRIDVYSASGDSQKNYLDLKANRIDMTRLPADMAAENDNETLMIMSLPYLFRDQEHKWRTINSHIGRDAENELASRGIIVLSWLEEGPKQLISRHHPIYTPDDAAHMKMSYQNDIMPLNVMRCLSQRAPVPILRWQLYRNLANEQVDGSEINWTTYGHGGFYEVAKFITETNHSQIPCVQVISRHAMNKLTPKEQAIVKECAKEAAEKEKDLFNKEEVYYKELALDNGAVLIKPNDREIKLFEDRFASIYQKYNGSQIMNLINEIRSM